jgi:hypothetical protein
LALAPRQVDRFSRKGAKKAKKTPKLFTSFFAIFAPLRETAVGIPYCLKIKSTPTVIRCLINKSTRKRFVFGFSSVPTFHKWRAAELVFCFCFHRKYI